MFPVLVVLFAVPLVMALAPLFNGGSLHAIYLLVSLLPAAGIGLVIWKWLDNPQGVKDYTQGGVVGFKDTPYRLTWYDWAVFMTRMGSIDKNSGVLRLDRRLCFGLIPLSKVLRPVGEFYRVELEAKDIVQHNNRHGYGRRNRGLLSLFMNSGSDSRIVRVDYTLRLVDRSADRLVVLDLSSPIHSGRGKQFVGRLREALEEIVGAPGRPPSRPRQEQPNEPPPDDFDAWREKQGKDKGRG